jgi:hypothetical protein
LTRFPILDLDAQGDKATLTLTSKRIVSARSWLQLLSQARPSYNQDLALEELRPDGTSMKTVDQIVAIVEDRIGHIYARPLMYGGTAHGVDLILHNFHELWAMILDLQDDYQIIRMNSSDEEGCGSANFATHYHRDRPQASDQETVRYVVDQWKKISDRQGLFFERNV